MLGSLARRSGAQTVAQALDGLLQPLLFPEHLDGVRIAGVGGGPVVDLQPGDLGAAPPDVFLQDLRTQADIVVRVEHRVDAGRLELVLVVARDHLHQALRPGVALRDRVEARLHRDDGDDEQRVESDALPLAVRRGDQPAGRLAGDAVALGDQRRQRVDLGPRGRG